MQHQLHHTHTSVGPFQWSYYGTSPAGTRPPLSQPFISLQQTPPAQDSKAQSPNCCQVRKHLPQLGSALAQAERHFAKCILTACQRGGHQHAPVHSLLPCICVTCSQPHVSSCSYLYSSHQRFSARRDLPRRHTVLQRKCCLSYCKKKGTQNSSASNRYS